ncbi:MAG: carboxypeptidase regulatory-like domain-containing protein [Bryobacterales bacterium]|nr:carboxypeptidase regulatory-like domain-containing protein [Bryobacterales bacterium]
MSASVQLDRMRSLCFLAAAAVICFAQQQPRTNRRSSAEPPGVGAISGYVRQADTGEPVRKAVVTAVPAMQRGGGPMNPPTASTDADGRFLMENVEAGQYRLIAERNGYVRGEYGARKPQRTGIPIQLKSGDSLTNLEIKLVRHSVVSGRITDEDGDPIQSAQVQLMRAAYARGRRQLIPATGGVSTNDLGEYRMYGIPPGRYYLAVTPRTGFAGAAAAGRFAAGGRGGPVSFSPLGGSGQNYAPMYFPGTHDLETATLLDLPAGSDFRGLDLRLAKVRTYKIGGRVIGAPNEGRGGMVMLVPKNSSGLFGDRLMAPFRASTGIFEIAGVRPGSYILTANIIDQETRLSARMPVEVGEGDIANLSITPVAGGQLTGIVRVVDGAALNLTSIRVQLQPSQEGPFLYGTDVSPVDAEGRFTIAQVSAGQYDVVVSGLAENGYVQSIKYGEADVLAGGLDLNSSPSGNLDITVSPYGAEITGAATNPDGNPQSGTVVLLIPATDRQRIDLYKTVNADRSGAYHFRGIPPGDYLLFALDDHERGAEFDPKYIEQFEKQAEKVTLRDRASESKPLKIQPLPN